MGVANLTGVTFPVGATLPASINSADGDTMLASWACAIDMTYDWSSTDDLNIFTAAGDSDDFTLTYDGGLRQFKSRIGASSPANVDKTYDEVTFEATTQRIQIWWEGAEAAGDIVYSLYYRIPSSSQDWDLDTTTDRILIATETVSTATLSEFITRDVWFGGIIGSSPHAPVVGYDGDLWQIIFNFDSNEHARYDGEVKASWPAAFEIRDDAQGLLAASTFVDTTDTLPLDVPGAGLYAGYSGRQALVARLTFDSTAISDVGSLIRLLQDFLGETVEGEALAILQAEGATDTSVQGALNELNGTAGVGIEQALVTLAETYTP